MVEHWLIWVKSGKYAKAYPDSPETFLVNSGDGEDVINVLRLLSKREEYRNEGRDTVTIDFVCLDVPMLDQIELDKHTLFCPGGRVG